MYSFIKGTITVTKATNAAVFATFNVTGSVTLSLYKGNVSVVSRDSDYSLYDPKIVTFEDDENTFDQTDATGFIKINSIRLKTNSKRK